MSQRSAGGDEVTAVIKESDVTESEFSRWRVALDNKMKADDLREQLDKKKGFKEEMLEKKRERQANIQAKVKEQRAKAKEKLKALEEEKMAFCQKNKEQRDKNRAAAEAAKLAYAAAGYELTRLHGPEQAKKTASRYVELARQKASFGQGGKEDRMALATQRIQQRTARLEEKRQLVESMKKNEYDGPQASKQWIHDQKKAEADQVRQNEKDWSEKQANKVYQFLNVVKSNHDKIDKTKAKAKDVRKQIERERVLAAAKEREVREAHAASLQAGEGDRAVQLKIQHDVLLARKYTAAPNAELVKQPLSQAAETLRPKRDERASVYGIEAYGRTSGLSARLSSP